MVGHPLPNFQPSRFRPLSAGVSISFDAALSVDDDAAVSTVIAQASVNGQDGPHTFTLTDDASGQFSITTGGEIRVAGALTDGLQSIAISATNGADDPATSAPSVSVNSLPVNTVAPSISAGVAGDEFTATPGTWTGFPTPVVTGQWRLADADIVGEDGLTYQSLVSDTGALVYRETATSVRGSVTQDSNAISLGVVADKAMLFVGIGQSLMAVRGSSVQTAPGSLNSGALKFVGGAHVNEFDFYAGNVEHPTNYSDVASTVAFAEGTTQSPLAGITNTLTGYEDMLLNSTALGARNIATLHATSYNIAAVVEMGVIHLIAEGYDPENIEIAFAFKQGEADATAGTDPTLYENRVTSFVRRCRALARQALKISSYVAPFHMSFPVQQHEQDDDRAIKQALLNVALAHTKFYFGEVWSVPIGTDRVHPEVDGYVLMGEKIGYDIANEHLPMRCLTAELTNGGNKVLLTFNKNVVRDTTLGKGTSLNAANAEDGVEYHNGTSFVALSNAVYSAKTVEFDLASTQTVGEVRIAVQNTDGTVKSGQDNIAGCFIRSDEAGRVSVYDPTYTHYDYAIPQSVEIS